MSADDKVTELQEIQASPGQQTLAPAEQTAIQGHLMGNWAGKSENAPTQKLKMSLRRKHTIDAERKRQLELEAQKYERDRIISERLKSGINDDGTQMTLLQRLSAESKLSAGTLQRQSFKKAMASPFQQFWMSDFEKQRASPTDRQEWMSRYSFVMAAIGSAVGIGNIWRFPYLTYKHGGAQFFLPYILSVIFIGVPLMIMELGIGQISGKGSGGAFRIIQKRLPGIGYASAFASFVILVYYNVIIGHSLIYLVYSFMSPMPWSGWKKDFPGRCKNPDQSRAEEVYNIDILQYYDQQCNELDDSDPTTFSAASFCASLAIWIICFICVYRGIRNIQYVVWATVPLPFIFLLVLLIRFVTLPGAGDGVGKYLKGEGVNTVTENNAAYVSAGLSDRTMWVDACGQVFFSLGVGMGIFTAYASHFKNSNKPILGDAVTVSLVDTFASFLAGFVVWGAIGFLQAKKDLTDNETENVALIFVTMPNAIDQMDASNAWMLLFTSMFFMLGLDTSFSFLEAVATTINDLDTFTGTPRALIVFIVTIVGIIVSIPFCFNWGFNLLDTVDHYLNTYLLIFIGIIQCYGCGWAFDLWRTMNKPGKEGENYYASTLISVLGYWIPLVVVTSTFIGINQSGWGALTFFLIQIIIVLPASFCASGLTFDRWYKEIFFCGVRRLGYAMTKRGREDPSEVGWWEPAFVFYWGFCVQYLTPALLWFVIVGSLYDDIETPFDEQNQKFQAVGILLPVLGFTLFFLATFLCVDEEIVDPTLLDDEATRIGSDDEDEPKDAYDEVDARGIHDLNLDRRASETDGLNDNIGRMPRGHRKKAAKDLWRKFGGASFQQKLVAAAASASEDKAGDEFQEDINN